MKPYSFNLTHVRRSIQYLKRYNQENNIFSSRIFIRVKTDHDILDIKEVLMKIKKCHLTISTLLILLIIGLDSSAQTKTIWSSFSTAKKKARDVIYKDHNVTFYCNCTYEPSSNSGGKIDVEPCDYDYRKSESRGNRLEWEHVVPASFFGSNLPCWTEGDEDCKKPGRTCCGKVDEYFHEAEVDLHNLVPSVGEINGDRSNHPYGFVEGEERVYGSCDFEVGGDPKYAEPRPEIRGDIARIWFYMKDTYQVEISEERWEMLQEWDQSDPIDSWEVERNKRILLIQGNANPYVDTGMD